MRLFKRLGMQVAVCLFFASNPLLAQTTDAQSYAFITGKEYKSLQGQESAQAVFTVAREITLFYADSVVQGLEKRWIQGMVAFTWNKKRL